jgi:hypothetical protein
VSPVQLVESHSWTKVRRPEEAAAAGTWRKVVMTATLCAEQNVVHHRSKVAMIVFTSMFP